MGFWKQYFKDFPHDHKGALKVDHGSSSSKIQNNNSNKIYKLEEWEIRYFINQVFDNKHYSILFSASRRLYFKKNF